MGKLKAKEYEGGSDGRFTVAANSVASFPIGSPTFVADEVYPNVGQTAYQTVTGLGITTNTTPSESISKIDHWLNTYLLDAPPRLTAGATEASTGYIQVAWTNPIQRKLGFTTTYIPTITRMRAIVVPSANNASQTYNHSSAWTITMETVATKPTVTSLRIVLDFNSGTSNLTSNRYSFFGTTTATRIVAETNYDIRVYAENESTISGDTTPRYIDFVNQATLGAGVPGAPSALAVNSITSTGATASWTAPTVRDINDAMSTALFARYQIAFTVGSTVRFGGALSVTTPQQTALASGTNAATSLALVINPGTTYDVTVAARNALNVNFGAASSPAVTFTSALPAAPSYPSSTGFAITNAASISYATAGFTLGDVGVSPVFRQSSMIATPPLGTVYTTSRLNATAGATSVGIATASTVLVTPLTTHTAARTFDGFGNAFSNGNTDSGAARVIVSADGDFHVAAANQGFFRSATIQPAATSVASLLVASPSPYTLGAAFAYAGAASVTTNTVTFYVDEMSTAPSVVDAAIISSADSPTYITGAPSMPNGAVLIYQVTIDNLVHTFLRNDRQHYTASIQTSSGTNISSVVALTRMNVNGTSIGYYAPPTPAYASSSTLHNTTGATLTVNPGPIQIRGSALGLVIAAANTFNDALRLSVTPINIHATGTAYTKAGRTDPATGTTLALRLDSASSTYLAGMSGVVMSAGAGQFPASGYTTTIDHTASIVGTDQLQLVNGRWSTPGVGEGYKNYGSFYFTGTPSQPDYSGISATGFRYVTIRYQNLKGSGTYDVITWAWTQTGLTLTPANDTANFRAYMKIVDGAFESPWVSLTAAINGAGWSAISSNGQGVMDNGNSTASSIRSFARTGTNANATVYLRVGLDMALNQTVTGITATAV
jgi:hypothetical protein